ncbi:MAG: WD40 repeat domain-containing protein [Anaerolineaceae bacterium]|nr:WD40 repeat domain-containing protein [Anaerolineaceae bacterium]
MKIKTGWIGFLCFMTSIFSMGFVAAQGNDHVGVYVSVQIASSDSLDQEDLQEIIDAVPDEWLGDSDATSRYEIRLIPSVIAREDCHYTVNSLPVTLFQKRVDIQVVITDLVSQERIGIRAFDGDEPFGCPAGGVFQTINGVPVNKTNYYLPDTDGFVEWLRDQMADLPDLVTGLVFQIGALRINDEVKSLSWSPDEQYIVTAGEESIARIWDSHTGEERFQLEGHDDDLSFVSFSPDGRVIATGDMYGAANIWSVDSRAILFSLDKQFGEITSIDFSPDHQLIATGTVAEVHVWDAATGRERWTTIVIEVFSVKFSSDGRLLMVGTGTSGVMVFDAQSGDVLVEGLRGEDSYKHIAVSPDNQFIALSGTEGDLRIWDFEQDATITLSGHTDEITGVAYSPDGNILLSSGLDGTIRFWKTDTWEEVYTLPFDPEEPINTLAFNATGDKIIVSQIIGTFGAETNISIWDVSNITHLPG